MVNLASTGAACQLAHDAYADYSCSYRARRVASEMRVQKWNDELLKTCVPSSSEEEREVGDL